MLGARLQFDTKEVEPLLLLQTENDLQVKQSKFMKSLFL